MRHPDIDSLRSASGVDTQDSHCHAVMRDRPGVPD